MTNVPNRPLISCVLAMWAAAWWGMPITAWPAVASTSITASTSSRSTGTSIGSTWRMNLM